MIFLYIILALIGLYILIGLGVVFVCYLLAKGYLPAQHSDLAKQGWSWNNVHLMILYGPPMLFYIVSENMRLWYYDKFKNN